MIHAAIFGLGRWGRRLVDSVQDGHLALSDEIRFVRGWTRTAERARDFAAERGTDLVPDLHALIGVLSGISAMQAFVDSARDGGRAVVLPGGD